MSFRLMLAIIVFSLLLVVIFSGCITNKDVNNSNSNENDPDNVITDNPNPNLDDDQGVVPVNQIVLKSTMTSLGNIITDVQNRTLYVFEGDSIGVSNCYEQCAVFWPPLLISEDIVPLGQEINATLGVIERTDNSFQVTVNGQPLYYYINDKISGDTKGQGIMGSGALWYVLSVSGQKVTNMLNDPNNDNTVPADTNDIAENTLSVNIMDFAFNPNKIKVNVGARVTWTQRDSVRHNVIEDNGLFSGPLLDFGETYSYTFTKAGTYNYYCGPHPNMRGTVIVE